MNVYIAWSLTGLYYLVYPIYFLVYLIANLVKTLLSPISSVLLFILQPLILFGQLVGYCTLAPFRFLQRFEVGYLPQSMPRIVSINMLTFTAKTIYIYLGVASLTGITCGLILHLVYSFLYSSLELAPQPNARGPTPRQYRASRRRKAKYQSDAMLSPVSLGSVLDTPGTGRHGLLAQTIHEEEDSDF